MKNVATRVFDNEFLYFFSTLYLIYRHEIFVNIYIFCSPIMFEDDWKVPYKNCWIPNEQLLDDKPSLTSLPNFDSFWREYLFHRLSNHPSIHFYWTVKSIHHLVKILTIPHPSNWTPQKPRAILALPQRNSPDACTIFVPAFSNPQTLPLTDVQTNPEPISNEL